MDNIKIKLVEGTESVYSVEYIDSRSHARSYEENTEIIKAPIPKPFNENNN